VRMVDVNTESYEVARSYMIRLEPEDLEEPQLSAIAALTTLAPTAFRTAFSPIAR